MLHVHIYIYIYIYLLFKAEKSSVHLSVFIFWHVDISVVSASIKTRLVQNQSRAFGDHKAYFYKFYKVTGPVIHRQECVKD